MTVKADTHVKTVFYIELRFHLNVTQTICTLANSLLL